jgi:NAD(P)-dependent dehydrogenase (short-subunit alcohol dehydrogenase family)
MSGRLADRVVLVTGSTGIGAATAELAAAEGAAVFVASRTEAHARELAVRITAGGGRARHRAADLTVEAEAIAAVDACIETFGRVDGLLSVAGGSGRRFGDGPIHGLSAEAWDRTLELNLRSHFLVVRETLRRMLDAEPRPSVGRGSIVLVGTVLASRPVPSDFGTHAYAAAKGGLAALTTTLAATYVAAGIRVNLVVPGLTATPMADRTAGDPRLRDFAERKQPLAGGLLDPADVAQGVVYLLSDESRAVTGQALAIDGGWSVLPGEPVAPGEWAAPGGPAPSGQSGRGEPAT